MMFSGVPRQSGIRVCSEASAASISSAGARSMSSISTSRRCVITSSTLRCARSSAPEKAVPVGRLHPALEMMKRDGAGDFLVRGEGMGILRPNPEHAQHAPYDKLDHRDDRRPDHHDEGHEARHPARHGV